MNTPTGKTPSSKTPAPGLPIGMLDLNPWNLKNYHVPWLGEAAADAAVKEGGELLFKTMVLGIRAGILLCYTYQRRAWNEPRPFVEHFAPPPENPTEAYIANVCAWTGFKQFQDLDFRDAQILVPWARAVWRQEQGAAADVITEADILAAKAMADAA